MLVTFVMHVILVFLSLFVVPPVVVVNGQGRSGPPVPGGGAGAGAGGGAGGGASVPQLPLLRGAFVPRSSFLNGRGGRSSASNLGRSTIAGARNTATAATTDNSPLTSRADAFTRRIVTRGGRTAFPGMGGRSASF